MIDYLEGFARGGSEAEFRALGFSKAQAKDMYERLVGEAVARNAEFRLRQDEAYRRRNSPMRAEKIPRDQ